MDEQARPPAGGVSRDGLAAMAVLGLAVIVLVFVILMNT